MNKIQIVFEDATKKIFTTENPDLLIQEFKQSPSLSVSLLDFFFSLMKKNNIDSYYVEKYTNTEIIVQRFRIIPFEITVRNVITKDISSRLSLQEGLILHEPIQEFNLKKEYLKNPSIDSNFFDLQLNITEGEVKISNFMAKFCNEVLKEYLGRKNILLANMKLEFGRTLNNHTILCSPISTLNSVFIDRRLFEKSGGKFSDAIIKSDEILLDVIAQEAV